ncbi:putative zinc finger protein [Apostichopus japonicus]|uniref:Putative zinc finger protein n=1 Tax=Stichopus japonicus TaxID=307972 RepID=A0A2G8KK70_STIJA|nr:putative zinc finger protein [Apostichopus japonicus]
MQEIREARIDNLVYCKEILPSTSFIFGEQMAQEVPHLYLASEQGLRKSSHKRCNKKPTYDVALFSCKFCGKGFKDDVARHIHEEIHNSQRPYKCKFCAKEFSCGSNRKVHERRHTGERPYECKLCPRAFSSSTNYKRHLKIHFR